MKTPDPRRYFLYVIFLALLAVLGFVFRSFVMDNLVRPLSLVSWLALRLFLAVDQKVYWILLIAFAFFQVVRHIPQAPGMYAAYPEVASQSALEHLKNWRALITLTTTPGEMDKQNLLRHNLIDLLVSLYATDREDGAAAYTVYDALKRREIPLPKSVYQFLFVEAPAEKKTIATIFRAIRQAPRRWVRRRRGEDVAEYYQSIDMVLAYMETSLEIPHDNQHEEQRDH